MMLGKSPDRRYKRALLASASLLAIQAPLSAQQLYIEEIVVTATKREASTQDVAVAVQALNSDALYEQNIGNFDDYVRFLPNVTSGGRGPGQSSVFIRGMAVQPITVLLSGAQGTTPNVALYLDEQPVTAPGRNLDVYATDLARIEVLPGPQGTLFGASSQAGTIRLITNKPQTDALTAHVQSSISFTEGGEASEKLELSLNLPLVEDKLALRAAAYHVSEGGYIDNVLGAFTLDPDINPLSAVSNLPVGTTYETATNTSLVEENFNDSRYQGVRASIRYFIDSNWEILLQHTEQDLESDGVFDYDPEVGDLEVTRFFPDELQDEFGLTSWTIEGRLAALNLLYTGAYLDRDITQSVDYTGYNNTGAFIAYYTCSYDAVRACLDPTKGFEGEQFQRRNTHEFRLSTDEGKRAHFVAGIYFDDFKIETLDNYIYPSAVDLGFAQNAPISTAVSIDPTTRAPGVTFFNDITRTEKQTALFGELSYQIMEDTLTATLGARYYDLEQDFAGSSNFAAGPFAGSVDNDAGRDYDLSGGHSDMPLTSDDIIYKFSLSYTPDEDLLFYATYSEGYRPGGFNRGGGIPSANPSFPTVNVTYGTDDVRNYEVGWKTTLASGAVQFNGNMYFIQWTDMQVSRFDPQNVSILTFIENAADADIKGIEGDFAWAAAEGLTLFGAFSYTDAKLKAIHAQAIELAPVGSSLPLTPKFQSNLRLRYEWQTDKLEWHAQANVLVASHSYSSLVAANRRRQDGYFLSDIAIGARLGKWQGELFVENIGNGRADLFINDQDDIPRVTTNRPRTIGLRLSYRY